MGQFVRVARTSELAPGRGMVVTVANTEIALFNVAGRFYAINNLCRHEGGPLGEGDLDDCVVTCPWHGWQYNVTTGKNDAEPSVCVESYPVRVQGDEVQVEI